MLSKRELDQIQIALFAMAKTKLNGRPVVDSDHVFALLKGFTAGELEVIPDADGDGLKIGFTPAPEPLTNDRVPNQ